MFVSTRRAGRAIEKFGTDLADLVADVEADRDGEDSRNEPYRIESERVELRSDSETGLGTIALCGIQVDVTLCV